MLKHLAAATLGFAALFGATGPATAGKGGHYWIDVYPSPYVYPYTGQSKYVTRRSRSQPNIKLDFETEAVWRNLRPEWFD
jgi:hypothetical protein